MRMPPEKSLPVIFAYIYRMAGYLNKVRFYRAVLSVSVLLFWFLSACAQTGGTETLARKAMKVPSVTAPELNTPYGWLNTDRPFKISDFKGKVLVLDFWTFGCVNCRHILPDLARLEAEYPDELVVVGVHSAKFDSEKKTENIRKAIQKFGITHPVVNDAGFKVWDSYAVRAWPTVVLITPEGKVVGQHAGEGVYPVLKPAIDSLLKAYAGVLNRKPVQGLHGAGQTASMSGANAATDALTLKFPSKLIADAEGNIWLTDTGHNRILKINPEGKLLEAIGKGNEGAINGAFAEASFNEPHGLALSGKYLYIADTRNHLIRRADLEAKTVETVCGNGQMDYYFDDDRLNEPVNPNSPFDLLAVADNLYIANSGNHQILRLDLKSNKAYRFAGTGREALLDGPADEAAFNQPSGLSISGNTLYVADPEASALRAINLESKTVTTLVGRGLFDFGDKDGPATEATLQHATGVLESKGLVYIADSYNGKIKVYNPKNKSVSTLCKGLSEPDGMLQLPAGLLIADANNNRLMLYSPSKNTLSELKLHK